MFTFYISKTTLIKTFVRKAFFDLQETFQKYRWAYYESTAIDRIICKTSRYTATGVMRFLSLFITIYYYFNTAPGKTPPLCANTNYRDTIVPRMTYGLLKFFIPK